MGLRCWLWGHKPLEVLVRKGVAQTLRDSQGNALIELVLCERCRGVYWIPSPMRGATTTPPSRGLS